MDDRFCEKCHRLKGTKHARWCPIGRQEWLALGQHIRKIFGSDPKGEGAVSKTAKT